MCALYFMKHPRSIWDYPSNQIILWQLKYMNVLRYSAYMGYTETKYSQFKWVLLGLMPEAGPDQQGPVQTLPNKVNRKGRSTGEGHTTSPWALWKQERSVEEVCRLIRKFTKDARSRGANQKRSRRRGWATHRAP